MKCPHCCGIGEVIKESDDGIGWIPTKCRWCNGTGEAGMTNEEWLKGCSTEELADKLTDFSFWLVPTIPTDEKREQVKRKLTEWLQEKHN